MTRLARVPDPPDRWDANPDILVCANGVLHIPSGKLYIHSPNHWATVGVPYSYDPTAQAPAWQRYVDYLQETLGSDVVDFLQEFAGYCLTTETKHHLALWLYGLPGGGKSTFIAGLTAMLSARRVGTLGLTELSGRFGLADLPGKTLMIATEQPARASDAALARMNTIISGEPVQVEQKFKKAYDFIPVCKVCFALNELPEVSKPTNGIFRRVKVVTFPPIPVERQDPDLIGRIRAEGPALLNWGIIGLRRLRERGRFNIPQSVRDATVDYQVANDTAFQFLEECCMRGDGDEFTVMSRALYARFSEWCAETGHKPPTETAMAAEWKRLGLMKLRRTARGQPYAGVRLLPKE